MATGLENLEPSNVADALGGTGDAGLNGILNAGFGSAYDFHDFVNVLVHLILRRDFFPMLDPLPPRSTAQARSGW
jgi:hypothetical protein